MSLRAPFPWFGDPMAYAKAHVDSGILQIDDRGRIWRTAIRVRGEWMSIPWRRAENPGGKGYLRVTLHVPGHGLVQVMAHCLVYRVKVGPISEGLQINHKNLVKDDNRPDNLEPVTGPENIQHSYANGRTKPWTHKKKWTAEWRPGRPVLTEEQIAAINARRLAGAQFKAIAAEFGISVTHAHRLCSRQESQ